jgi:hypothetical protein
MKIFPRTFKEFLDELTNPARNEQRSLSTASELNEELTYCKTLEDMLSKYVPFPCVLSAKDNMTGEIGYVIEWGDEDLSGSREGVHLRHRIFNAPEIILCQTVEKFKEVYEEAISKNYFMDYVDDPNLLRIGILVVKGDGNIIYYIRLGVLKRYLTESTGDK